MTRLPIETFLDQAQHSLILDVRSPAEYGHAHLPGARSLPLFTDEERKVVGTTYKQESREAAIKIGLDYFGPKMRIMVEEVETLVRERSIAADGQRPTVSVYCWRGGMRSAAVAWLLDLYGFKVQVLAGGYKSFRNHVLRAFALPVDIKLVGGYTGSGKTAILNELVRNGEPVVDLEALASHKGSAFGNIDMPPQPSQEMFENRLALELYQAFRQNKTVWLEDESQRIGHINLPADLWHRMRQAPIYFLEIPFEARLAYLVAGYGGLDRDRMREAIGRISKRLGPAETKNALGWLDQGDMEQCFRVLLLYYDKHYLKGLHNRNNLPILLHKIECSSVDPANASLLLSKPMLHEKPGSPHLDPHFL